MKIITFVLIGLLLLTLIGVKYFIINKMKDKEQPREYQGPVPEGYDEEHFRKTGETILIENG